MAVSIGESQSTPEDAGQALMRPPSEPTLSPSSQPHVSRRIKVPKLSWFSVVLVVAGLSSLALIYVTLREVTGESPDRQLISNLLIANGVLAISLIVAILFQLITVWSRGKAGLGAAQLHKRLVLLVSVSAIVPAVIVAMLSMVILTFSFNSLFGDDEPFPSAIGNLRVIASGFVREQISSLRVDARTLAPVVDYRQRLLSESPIRFQQFLAVQSALRKLESVYIVDGEGRRLAGTSLGGDPPRFTIPSPNAFELARQGKLAIFSDVENRQFRGFMKLQAYDNAYLLIGRRINSEILAQLDQTRTIINEFDSVQSNQEYVVGALALASLIVSLIVLLAAIRGGLNQADDLASPIDKLVQAAERVSLGDLTARVEVRQDADEIDRLSHTFNRMTNELQSQTDELVEANEQLDARRRFTEAVLAGVSAGVIGLDSNLDITIANRSAIMLLATPRDALIGRKLLDVIPEITDLLARLRTNRDVFVEDHIEISRNAEVRHLNVQISGDHGDPQSEGFVVTFDDITKLISAQRTAAWADVARRIAHEIKNPLTPIQLSAERLRRKYLGDISGDTEVFEQCTDTIVRQVKDIGRMVDEFSSFARMPAPVIKPADLTDLIKQVVFSQRVANPDIDYQITISDRPLQIDCDSRLIAQALTNILKNAAEAIGGRNADTDAAATDDKVPALQGRIDVDLVTTQENVEIVIKDNGCGLPEHHRNRLTEPYMTTREKGTGLGLAIVKKVMEDHGGELVLANRQDGVGAEVRLRLLRSGSNLATSQAPVSAESEANPTIETVGQ